MKKRFLLMVIALLLCVTPFLVQTNEVVSAEELSPKTITVTGCGEVNITPDYAIVSVGIETLQTELVAADKENNDAIKAVMAVLSENGISNENIKTTNYYVDKRYDYSDGQKFLGYQVNNRFDFRTKDLDGLETLLSKLVAVGANNISGIRFNVEDYSTHYNKSLSLALEDAKSKAQILAGEGITITMGEIEEENYYYYCGKEYMSLGATKDIASSIARGEMTVSAKIKVDFNY